MSDNKRYNTILKKSIPTKEEAKVMVDSLAAWLPMTREQIVHRAIEKYYLHHKAKRDLQIWDVRGFLMGEQGHECYYCRKYLSNRAATVDHKTPTARGGTSDIENLCLSCSKCNNEKGTMNEEEYKQVIHNRELEQKAWPELQLS